MIADCVKLTQRVGDHQSPPTDRDVSQVGAIPLNPLLISSPTLSSCGHHCGWPITLGVIMILLVVALIVGWVTVTVIGTERSAAYWALLAVGTTFLVLVLVGVVLYLLISVKEIRLNRRQSNFIDSVTHELKSPIASLKLYLQTLSRRNVDEQRQADFYRFMLEDVDRLDT